MKINDKKIIALVSLLMIFVCAIVYYLNSKELAVQHPLKFNKQQWRITAENKRYVYVEDMINTKILDGLTKKQVIDLLGEPSYGFKEEYISYLIKDFTEFSTSESYHFDVVEFFIVVFDKKTKVKRYYTYKD